MIILGVKPSTKRDVKQYIFAYLTSRWTPMLEFIYSMWWCTLWIYVHRYSRDLPCDV